jgi:uncharacterized protein YbjT (DUF2867 family)
MATETVTGDLADPEALSTALDGVDAVLLLWPFLTTDGADRVIEAVAGKRRRLVYVSSSGVDEARARQVDPINQLHADMESLIRRRSPDWTVLRADSIAGNARGWAGQLRATSLVRGPRAAAAAVVHEDDVAAVAVRALTDDGHGGHTYVLTGPQVLTRPEQVAMIGDVIGKPALFEEVPVDVARAQMLADGRPPTLVEALLTTARSRPDSTLVTPTVREVTGAPARTFRHWIEENADMFR